MLCVGAGVCVVWCRDLLCVRDALCACCVRVGVCVLVCACWCVGVSVSVCLCVSLWLSVCGVWSCVVCVVWCVWLCVVWCLLSCGTLKTSVCAFKRREEGRGGSLPVLLTKMVHVGLSLDPREVHQKQLLDLTHLRFESRSRTTCHRFLQSFAISDTGVPLQLS